MFGYLEAFCKITKCDQFKKMEDHPSDLPVFSGLKKPAEGRVVGTKKGKSIQFCLCLRV